MNSSCNFYARSNNFILIKKYILAMAWGTKYTYLSESIENIITLDSKSRNYHLS